MTDEPTSGGVASPSRAASRRAVLAGAGGAVALVMLTGCTTYDARGGGQAGSGGAGGGGGGDPTKPLVAAADIPVGGGVVTDRGVVVTQPTAGKFLGFSSVCTHQGCTVGGVRNGVIVCPCHGSEFKIVDGSVATGPANRPLNNVAIKVSGTDIFLA